MEEQSIKEVPYGVSDFSRVRRDNMYYVDKTMFLSKLEKEKDEKKEAYEARIQKQWDDAKDQINRYAAAPRVEALRQGTQLHKIIIQFDGYKLYRMDEV